MGLYEVDSREEGGEGEEGHERAWKRAGNTGEGGGQEQEQGKEKAGPGVFILKLYQYHLRDQRGESRLGRVQGNVEGGR